MSLVCRSATAEEVPRIAALASHSFPAAALARAAWESTLTEPEHGGLTSLWVAERDGELIGGCRLLSYQQWLGGVTIPIMGLSTVTVSPGARRQGVAAELVTSSIRAARERGDAASLLYPFRTAFYRKLGYGMAGEARQYTVPPKAFVDDPGRTRVTIAHSLADRDAVSSVYDRWAPLSTGQLARTPHSWSRVWQNDTRHAALFRDGDGNPQGYLVFHYLLPGPGQATVAVEEAVWLTPEARRALYAWLGSLADQWDSVIYRAHPQDHFEEHLVELRNPTPQPPVGWHFWFAAATILRGPMFRIIDIERAWSARTLNEGRAMVMALHVRDSEIAENSGWWTLKMGNLKTTATAGRPASPDVTLETDIETLSRIYAGSLAPSVAVSLGTLSIDRRNHVGMIDQLLRLPMPWTFDRF